jgi:hypothetical protein
MCECHRIVIAHRLFERSMTQGEKCEVLLSDKFQLKIKHASPCRNPDIYYRNPYTEEWQHLFRVVGIDLLMRPSNIANHCTGSVNLQCIIECSTTSGEINISWSGNMLKSLGSDIFNLFV